MSCREIKLSCLRRILFCPLVVYCLSIAVNIFILYNFLCLHFIFICPFFSLLIKLFLFSIATIFNLYFFSYLCFSYLSFSSSSHLFLSSSLPLLFLFSFLFSPPLFFSFRLVIWSLKQFPLGILCHWSCYSHHA